MKRKLTRNFQVDNEQPTAVSELDQRRILLAWNGDANYVAVSYVENESNFRRFCVFDHEGELISHLQQVSNVEETLAYRCKLLSIFISKLKYFCTYFSKFIMLQANLAGDLFTI